MRSIGLVIALGLLAWLAHFLLGGSSSDGNAGALGPADMDAEVVIDPGELSAPSASEAAATVDRRTAEPFTPEVSAQVESPADVDTALTLSFLVVDLANGLPIADARIGFEAEPLAVTDAAGRTSVVLAAHERRERLHVQAAGYARALVLLDHAATERDVEYRIELSRSAGLQGRVFGLDPGASHEVILATSWRSLVQPFVGYETGYGNHEWSALVGTDGSFMVEGLAPLALLFARLESDGADAQLLQLEAIELAPGELRRIEWDLSEDCAVYGRVLDADGAGVAEVGVDLREGANSFAYDYIGEPSDPGALTDASGRFRIEGLRPGEYLVGLGSQWDRDPADQHAASPVHVTLARGEERAIDLIVHEAAFLSGRVLTAKGKPQRSAALVAIRGGVLAWTSNSDEDGQFHVGPLIPGEYELWVDATSESHDATPPPLIVVAPAEDLVVQLLEAGSLRGKIIDPETGERLAGHASLQAVVGDGFHVSQPPNSEIGPSFAFRSLPPGRFDLLVEAQDGRIGILRDIELEQGQRINTLEVPVAPSGELRIRMTPRSDRGLRVSAGTLRLFDFRAVSSSQQRIYAPPGPVEVAVMKRGSLTGFNDWVPEETRIVMVTAGAVTEVEFD